MTEQNKCRKVELEVHAANRALHFETALHNIMRVSHEGGPSAHARMYDIARTALKPQSMPATD